MGRISRDVSAVVHESVAWRDEQRVAIQRDSERTTSDDEPLTGGWKVSYEFTRRARYDEVFRVWVRDR